MATCRTCKGKKFISIPCPMCSDTTDFVTTLQIKSGIRCDECFQYGGNGEVLVPCPCTQNSDAN